MSWYLAPQPLLLKNIKSWRIINSFSQGNLITFSATTVKVDDMQLHRKPSFKSSRPRHEFSDSKVIHREVERKRRQQMSNLYASLRTLLPNKGGRSVCDQIEEATNYIKRMHKKIEQLRIRRDDLKKLERCSSVNNEISSDGLHKCVEIQKGMDGVEILISSKHPESELSRVVAQLVERELHVVRCFSTRTKEGFLHQLSIEVRDMKNLEELELRDILTNAINK